MEGRLVVLVHGSQSRRYSEAATHVRKISIQICYSQIATVPDIRVLSAERKCAYIGK